ncbi:hypothetical protein [Streptomyces sp. SLBN-31]|uniref:hypothetical protein n=1 Tax=Streptomyces sp. SLBN-31 TaxID=2768444 RepID=UPI0011506601|nr:hypothetical protein [Streptomyces sp. SLBN-31]
MPEDVRHHADERAEWAVPLFSHPAKAADEYDVSQMCNVDPRWQPDNFEKNVEAVGKLGGLAAAKGRPLSRTRSTTNSSAGQRHRDRSISRAYP